MNAVMIVVPSGLAPASGAVARTTSKTTRAPGASSSEMPADEVTHHRDGLVRVRAGLLDEAVAGTREVDALDLATGLLVGANERLGDRGGHVVVELRLSDPDRRQRPGFAGRHDARDTGRGHRDLVREVP